MNYISILIIAITLIFQSCKKQDAPMTVDNDRGIYMDFRFKGVDYSFAFCYAVYDSSDNTFGISGSGILANNLSGSVGIIFSGDTKGTYLFGNIKLPTYSHLEVAFSSDAKTSYSQYLDCDTSGPVLYNEGNVFCTGTGTVGEYVAGSFCLQYYHILDFLQTSVNYRHDLFWRY